MHPSWKQLGNEFLCLLLPGFASSSDAASRTEVPIVVPTQSWNHQTLLCCMEMYLMSIHTRQRKSWDPNTLRKTQTWICMPWLISASVFDPTKILDLNFRGRLFSIQLGWTRAYMCVCRHLQASCTAFVFLSFHHLLKLLSIFCLWVLDVTDVINFPLHYGNGGVIIPSWSPLNFSTIGVSF